MENQEMIHGRQVESYLKTTGREARRDSSFEHVARRQPQDGSKPKAGDDGTACDGELSLHDFFPPAFDFLTVNYFFSDTNR